VYLVQFVIRTDTAVRERNHLAEIFAEFLLADIELRQFSTDICHLVCLQWCHLLFDADRQLLAVVPLLRQLLLNSNNYIHQSGDLGSDVFICKHVRNEE